MAEAFLSPTWYRAAALKPRLRPHAEISAHRYGRRTWYVLQDHATGRVHRFTPAAYLLINRMNGQATLDEIWSEAAAQLEDDAPTQEEVLRLMAQLHANDVLQLESSPQASELLERYAKKRRSSSLALFKNPLSTKIPLIDPDAILRALVRIGRPLHGWPLAVLWLVCVGSALVQVPLYWTELTTNLSDRVLSTQNLVALALVYPVVKLLHELGHGYATRAYGGEVHEAGLMLLVLYPVPYVDASTSLAFRSKYQRALVGLAGMGVELVVAALAFHLWLAVEPGVVRAVAFNVMLIGGVSTLVVNGNPLLRFDAYYILSDLIEIPNLGPRCNRYWAFLVERLGFGAKDRPPDATAREAIWFLVYGPTSYVYRLLVLFGIALFIATEFFAIGVVLALWSLATGLVLPIGKGLHHVVAGPDLRQHRRRAVGVTFGLLALGALALLALPIPLHTTAEGVIWLPEDAQVRAGTNGFVRRLLVAPGSQVQPGVPLFESYEPTLASELSVQRARVDELSAQLMAETVTDRVKAEITRKELEAEGARLARLEERESRLVVTSAAEGTLVVPQADDLPGRFVREGQVIAYVTPPEGHVVRAVVTQDDIDLVRHRLRGIEAKIPGRLSETFTGVITREVPGARNEVPSRVLTAAGGGHLATDPSDREGLRALQRLFAFDIALTPEPDENRFGSRVYLRFEHVAEPLGFQLYRRLRQLFLARFQA